MRARNLLHRIISTAFSQVVNFLTESAKMTTPALKKMSNRAPAPTLPRDLCHENFDPKRSLGLLILVDVALFSLTA